MAGAEAILPSFPVNKPPIPKRLIRGSKFLKWPKADDDVLRAVPITLRLDEKCHVIYWQEPQRDAECLELSSIRDTRVGKYAKEPKDPELSKMVSTSIPLSDRCFTIVYGPNFVDVSFLNFIAVEANAPDVIKEWADFLLTLAYHPTTRHLSVQTNIEKAFTKLKLEVNQFGELPIKKLIKLLGGRSKRVENALSSVGLPSGHKKTIIPSELQLTRFKKLIQLCCQRPELDTIFSDMVSGARRMYIPHQKMKDFINTVQRDPKLNEILYPYYNEEQTLEMVQSNEPNQMFGQRGQLTQEGFDAYLQSNDNLITGIEYYAEYQDMTQPLTDYLVNSSHNTYLTGNQYRSKSTAEMYRQVLLSGCRCVELDCWEGETEPYINHGFTLCTPIPFKDVVEAINESAFKTSPYPVILSFENHVETPAQQAKMAQYCRDIFKDKLLIDPLESHPIEPGRMLPSPKDLMYKIIIKNKKQKHVPKKRGSSQVESFAMNGTIGQLGHQRTTSTSSINSLTKTPRSASKKPLVSPLAVKTSDSNDSFYDKGLEKSPSLTSDNVSLTSMSPSDVTTPTANENGKFTGKNIDSAQSAPPLDAVTEDSGKGNAKKDSFPDDNFAKETSDAETNFEKETKDDDNEDSEDEGTLTNEDFEENAKESGTASKESKAYEAMSSLVNYIQPVRFKQFETSEKKNRSNEISSFTESAALRLLTFYPFDFVRYNRRQTSRIYPKGARVDSSNYMPQVFWNVGCQFAALNFQVLDVPMQLNLGLFEFNGSTGLLLKPEHMRKKDRMFDPFAKNIDGIVASTLTIRIISGQFLSQQKLSTFVEVDMFGLPNDTIRRAFKTRTVDSNSINPYYNSTEFLFKKIVLPNLAMLRIAVMDTSGNLVGHRLLKIEGLKPGYRYITLRNESNQPITMASLFVHIQVKDFVPEVHKDFANWLANPIPYWEKVKKDEIEREAREKAMHMLLDPWEIERFDQNNFPSHISQPYKKPNKKPSTPSADDSKKKNESSRPDNQEEKDGTAVYLEKFEPLTIEDLKLFRPYKKLMSKQEDSLQKLRKKHKEEFIQSYCVMFGNLRRPSVFEAFKKVYNNRRKESRIDMSPAQSDEAKKDELLKLMRIHFDTEMEHQMKDIDNFLEKFEVIIKDHQKSELNKLKDQSNKEQIAIQKKKDVEKERRIRLLPPNLTREELENKKKEINDAHIKDCVQQRTILLTKQTEREKAVLYQQQETLDNLEKEKKTMQGKIDAQHSEKLQNIYSIYDNYCIELNGGSKMNKIDENDGEYVSYL